MIAENARVHHGDDDARIAGGDVPGVRQVDERVVPLQGEEFVVGFTGGEVAIVRLDNTDAGHVLQGLHHADRIDCLSGTPILRSRLPTAVHAGRRFLEHFKTGALQETPTLGFAQALIEFDEQFRRNEPVPRQPTQRAVHLNRTADFPNARTAWQGGILRGELQAQDVAGFAGQGLDGQTEAAADLERRNFGVPLGIDAFSEQRTADVKSA